MSANNIFRRFNQRVLPTVISRGYAGEYKIIKRPDPSKLKIPSRADSPNLLEVIKEKIKLSGPLTVADYMNIVTTNPTEGYYTKKEVIGQGGDFITSPEISQLFGEIIGIWFYSETKKMGSGIPLQIVELGPGRGTLLIDILRVVNHLGHKAADISLHLVEISEMMQNMQANRLCIAHKGSDLDKPHYHEGETVGGSKVYWYSDIKKVPQGFSWFIAHEFFDALPIHKFQKTEEGWREILIDIDETGKLLYKISAKETPSVKILIRAPLDTDQRNDLEVSSRGLGIARQLAQRVDQHGGIALIADYGHDGEKGDTFRAFHKHQLADPLENPGAHDLTADVDFKQLRLAASLTPGDENHALVLGPVKQMDFLKRSQADLRLQVLMDNTGEENKENLKSAYDMLTNPNKMGDRFKFMAFYPSAMASIIEKYPPLGFSNQSSD